MKAKQFITKKQFLGIEIYTFEKSALGGLN